MDALNTSYKDPKTALADPRRYYDEQFFDVMVKLFKQEDSGHGAEEVHKGGLSAKFNELVRRKSYYPAHEEEELIHDKRFYYAHLVRQKMTKGGPLTVVELGPGAASPKTRLFLEAVKPDYYFPVDTSLESLLETSLMVRDEFPLVKQTMRLGDFYKDNVQEGISIVQPPKKTRHAAYYVQDKKFPEDGLRLVVQFGQTLGNRKGFVDSPAPRESVIADMHHIRHTMMRPGDIAIYGIDMNQRGGSIRRAYSSKVNEELVMRTVKRVQTELPVSESFNPADFRYKQIWNEATGLFGHGLLVHKDTSFRMGLENQHHIELEAGTLLSFANSYRFKQEFLDEIYPHTDQKLLDVLTGPKRRMHHQVLEAV